MLRVAEHYSATDTGRQRRANEDALLSRAPLFVVADGMGGAQAGEVASQLAVDAFKGGVQDVADPEAALAALTREANARIHELSYSHSERAGMGTTLTAIYVGPEDVAIAHVGDSRAYCLRDGELMRLTDDHSLVDELMRQGRLSAQEAEEHPQRSVITRALGPEASVQVDTRSFRGRGGDVFLLCSDGLTSMLSEHDVARLLRENQQLRAAGEALVAGANAAGGRDNITVVLVRLEEVGAAGAGAPGAGAGAAAAGARAGAPARHGPPDGAGGLEATMVRAPAVSAAVARRLPRRPEHAAHARRAPRERIRRAGALVAAAAVLGVIAAGAYIALQSVYFIGTNNRGLVTLYRGVPFKLPGNLTLYSSDFVSGVSASTIPPARRHALLDHSLRSEANAAALIRSLELGQLE